MKRLQVRLSVIESELREKLKKPGKKLTDAEKERRMRQALNQNDYYLKGNFNLHGKLIDQICFSPELDLEPEDVVDEEAAAKALAPIKESYQAACDLVMLGAREDAIAAVEKFCKP